MSGSLARNNDRRVAGTVTVAAYLEAACLDIDAGGVGTRCVALSRKQKRPVGSTILTQPNGKKKRLLTYRVSIISEAVNAKLIRHEPPTLEQCLAVMKAARQQEP